VLNASSTNGVGPTTPDSYPLIRFPETSSSPTSTGGCVFKLGKIEPASATKQQHNALMACLERAEGADTSREHQRRG